MRYIIDSGFAKESIFDNNKNMIVLQTNLISKSSAEQRKGRAGRTAPGLVYRIYSKDDYKGMKDYNTPDILKTPLDLALLNLYG